MSLCMCVCWFGFVFKTREGGNCQGHPVRQPWEPHVALISNSNTGFDTQTSFLTLRPPPWTFVLLRKNSRDEAVFTGPSHTINRLYLKPTVHDSAVDILLSVHDLACKLMWPLGNVASTNCCLIVIVKVSMVLKLQSKYCETSRMETRLQWIMSKCVSVREASLSQSSEKSSADSSKS